MSKRSSIQVYQSMLSSPTYGLWSGKMDVSNFMDSFGDAVFTGLRNAWLEGAALAGVTEEELTDAELSRMQTDIYVQFTYIAGFADFIISRSRANGGKLESVMPRLQMWVSRYGEFVTRGLMMAKLDQKMQWRLGETDKHCFIPGTIIKTEDTWGKPIEEIKVGDIVLTEKGWNRVQNIMKRRYSGKFYKVSVGNKEVICTDNHPFLTDEGWKEAKDLSNGDNVSLFDYDTFKKIESEITLPNSNNNKPAFYKVGILSRISFSLRNLSICQRFKAWMTMPKVTIHLNDKFRLNEKVDNEIRLNKSKHFILNTEFVKKYGTAFFQFIGFHASIRTPRFNSFLVIFFDKLRMILVPFFSFINSRLSKHWIIFFHILTNNRILFFLRHSWFLAFSSSFFRRWFTYCRFISTIFTAILFPRFAFTVDGLWNELIATNRTRDRFQFSGFIPANRRTEIKSPFMALENHSIKTISAKFTDEGSRLLCFRFHSCIISEWNLYPMLVYNLTIENSHTYIANGFLVHNCGSCVKLDGKVKRASQWLEADIYPKHPKLECKGYYCLCELSPTNEPMSKGKLPRLP